MDDDEFEDDGEGEVEIHATRTNGWTLALIGFQFLRDIFTAVADAFEAMAAVATNKWETKEDQRVFREIVTLQLETIETLPEAGTTDGPGAV